MLFFGFIIKAILVTPMRLNSQKSVKSAVLFFGMSNKIKRNVLKHYAIHFKIGEVYFEL